MPDAIEPNTATDAEGQALPDHVEENAQTSLPEKTYDLSNKGDLFSLIKDEVEESEIRRHLSAHIKKLVEKHKLSGYRLVLLFDSRYSISQYHSNKIYDVVADINKKSDILMILVSDGGKIEPAYLISKACKRLAKNKFVVAVPRRAKSAATLISLGANEIHMGLLSELGPIDPQFGGFPALGLANAVEKIAALSTKFPHSAEMFAKYLTANLDIKDLGYFERINESATQYAQRLLDGKTLPDGKTPEILADHLTNHYKDHSFVIDSDEASRLFGKNIIKEATKEYEFANDLYGFLDFADTIFRIFKKSTLRWVGSIETGFDTNEIKE